MASTKQVTLFTGPSTEPAPCISVLAAYNQITSRKQMVILPKAEHQDEQGTQAAYNTVACSQWLPKLAKGEAPPIKTQQLPQGELRSS